MRGLSVFLLIPAVLSASVQLSDLQLPDSAAEQRDAVKKIFTDSYNNYRRFAFGHDDVQPVSKSFNDGLNGWGATIVDALGTLHIMGIDDLFLEAVNFTSTIDYSRSKTSSTVSVFETTIRHLGGLLSAYELTDKQHPILLQKATEIANRLSVAWKNNNAIPFGHIDFNTDLPDSPNETSNIAEAGTLILEWSRLTQHTQNDTYNALALRAMETIANNPAPLPGLAAQGISPRTGLPVGASVTWGGGSDSYFEYLIKYARFSNTDDPLFINTWATAVDTSIKVLLQKSTVGDHSYLADYDSSKNIRHVGSHLACFHGGNWIFGGKLLNNQTIVDIGLDLVDACWNTYASTSTGIGPEVFAWIGPDGNFTGNAAPTDEQLEFYQENGFYILASDYIQRPEVLESNFYAWRATGNTKYLDRAASAIKSFQDYLRLDNGGIAGLNDVDDPSQGLIDDTQSFFFAETLKYLYLTFDDPAHISLNDWVFNTECHPLLAPAAKDSYTSTLRKQTQPFQTTSGTLPEISPSKFLPSLKKILNPGTA